VSLCLCLFLSLFKKKLQTSSSQAMQEIGWYQKTKKTTVVFEHQRSKISCHKDTRNFSVENPSSRLGGASSNIYLSWHNSSKLCSGILTLRNLRSIKQEADFLPQNSSKLCFL
jgi:hypothetical protein